MPRCGPLLDQDDDLFLGRLMVAWGPLRAALTRGGSEQATDRVALLRAVTDWYRVHMPRLLSRDVLSYLYRAYRAELTGAGPGNPVSAAGFRDALQWATAAPAADRPRLIDLQDVPGGQRYAPHPLLAVIADDPEEDAGWPVADALWSYADQYLRGDQRRDIGYSALARGACQAAARLLSHADTTVDPGAYGQIALLFYERGEWVSSRDWWRRAINTGDPDQAPRAMDYLGILEGSRAIPDQARHWYQQAIGTGHPDVAPSAMVNLGRLEESRAIRTRPGTGTSRPSAPATPRRRLGRWSTSANLEKRAGRPGPGPALVPAGHRHRPPRGGADRWSTSVSWNTSRATWPGPALVPAGHRHRPPRRGAQGDGQPRRRWKENRAIRARPGTGTSRPSAPATPTRRPGRWSTSAILKKEQGDLGQARHWYQQAIGTGHPDQAPRAMVNLGDLEEKQGDLGQARHWYQQAIGTGHPDEAPRAMGNLASWKSSRAIWIRPGTCTSRPSAPATPTQAPRAMVNLGILETEQGDPGQARHWYQQAIDTGQPREGTSSAARIARPRPARG